MTVFDAGPRAQTPVFHPGDVSVARKCQGHRIQNFGTTALQLIALFKTPEYQDVSLSDWLPHTSSAVVTQTLNIEPSILRSFVRNVPGIVPTR